MDHIRDYHSRMNQRINATFGLIEDEIIMKAEANERATVIGVLENFEKSKKEKAPIGTIKAFGGRNYIQTAEGWKYHGKGGGVKAQENSKAAGHAAYGVGEGHSVVTDKGVYGKVAKRDETHTYIEHKDEKGKPKVSKVGNEDVDNNIAAGKWEHHIPAKQAQEKAQQTVEASVGTGSKGKEQDANDAMASEKMKDINFRFKTFATMVKGVIQGKFKSALAYGTGGVGKTYTVEQQLAAAGKKKFDAGKMKPGSDDYDYVKITGKATPVAVYRALYEHNNKIIMFDDCDSALRNPDSQNFFKGALDTSGDGTISYGSSKSIKDEDGVEIPQTFTFKGRVIFISNLSPEDMPQPLKSRAAKVDLSMDKGQTIDRIREIAKNPKTGELTNLRFPGIDQYTSKEMSQVIDYLEKYKDNIGDLNVRTIGKVLGMKQLAEEDGDGKNWEKYADQEIFSKSEDFNYDGGLFKSLKQNVISLYKSKKKSFEGKATSIEYVEKAESEQLVKSEKDELEEAIDDLFMKGGPGSGRYQHKKKTAKQSTVKKDPSVFKDEDDVEDKFFAIKDEVMKEYGVDDDEDEYDEQEDDIMGETRSRFQNKYGYEFFEDAKDAVRKYKTTGQKK